MKNFGKFVLGFNRRLSNIERFNTRPRIQKESVATHSYFVSLYASLLADYAIKQGQTVDVAKAIKKALLHDIEESVAGDVKKPIKALMLDAYNKIADISVKTILEHLPDEVKDEYLDLALHTPETGEGDFESLIVSIADDISGVVYSKEEMNMGNNYFRHVLQDYMKRLRKKCDGTCFEGMYEDLEKELISNNEIFCD